MKKKERSELRIVNAGELAKKLVSMQKDLVNLKLDLEMKKSKNLRQVFKKKKDIAQLLTILAEKRNKI